MNFETLLQAIQEGSDELLKEVTDVIAVEIIRTECCKTEVSMLENYLELKVCSGDEDPEKERYCSTFEPW